MVVEDDCISDASELSDRAEEVGGREEKDVSVGLVVAWCRMEVEILSGDRWSVSLFL